MVIESWRGCGMNGGRVMKVEAAFFGNDRLGRIARV